ncbi:MAG: hypothetical protein HGA36_04660 [Candidatus Moranbacteria bacterium]|nr:hypothetical protein [Candidatus Moranbacteria bacterium]
MFLSQAKDLRLNLLIAQQMKCLLRRAVLIVEFAFAGAIALDVRNCQLSQFSRIEKKKEVMKMSMRSLWARMELEMFLGPSHECHQCGRTFLANEDGCPICGIGARVSSLHEPLQFLECKENDIGNVIAWDKETGNYIVGHGEFSLWPRI